MALFMFSSLTETERLLFMVLLQRQIRLSRDNIFEWYTITSKSLLPDKKVTQKEIINTLNSLCEAKLLEYGSRYFNKEYYINLSNIPLQFLFDMVKDPLWDPSLAITYNDFTRCIKSQTRYYDISESTYLCLHTTALLFDACFRNDISTYLGIIQRIHKFGKTAKNTCSSNMLIESEDKFWQNIVQCPDHEAMQAVHPYLQLLFGRTVLADMFFNSATSNFFSQKNLFEIMADIPKDCQKDIPQHALEDLMALAILQGQPEKLSEIADWGSGRMSPLMLPAMQAFAAEDWKNATGGFAKIFKELQTTNRHCGKFFVFIMLWSEIYSQHSGARFKTLSTLLHPWGFSANAKLEEALWDYTKTNDLQSIDLQDLDYSELDYFLLSQLFCAIPTLKQNKDVVNQLSKIISTITEQGFIWVAALMVHGLCTAFPNDTKYQQQWQTLSAAAHLSTRQTTANTWDALINSLNSIFNVPTQKPAQLEPSKTLPIAWCLDTDSNDDYNSIDQIQAYRLKSNTNEADQFYVNPLHFSKASLQNCYSKQDTRLLQALAPQNTYSDDTYVYIHNVPEDIIKILCDVDYVYRCYTTYETKRDRYGYQNRVYHRDRITLKMQKVTILADTHADGSLKLSLPDFPFHCKYLLQFIQPGQYALIVLDEQIQRFQSFLREYGKDGAITIPAEATSQFQPLFNAIGAKYTISGKLGKEALANLETVDSENAFVLRIEQLSEGFTLALFAKPCAKASLLLPPAAGKPQCSTDLDGKVVWIQRDLKREKELLMEFLDTFSELEPWESGEAAWLIENLEDSLKFIEHFKAEEPSYVTLEWNRKKPLKIAKCGGWKDITLHSGFTADQWFSMGADIHIDDTDISLAELLQAVQQSSSNFVKIDDDTYLELTSILRKQLQAMAALAQKKAKSNDVELPPAALPMLAGILDDDVLPSNLLDVVASFRKTLASKPKLPKGLTADLRDYQVEGFTWLRQLADCKIGCCLADDMGIGKTLQAISLLLDIASRGPSLVVTPASLGTHWYNECTRFAPQLHAIVMPTAPEERKQIVNNAKAFDLVICTYGVLMTEGKLLASRSWNCLVLDEAQAIKNKGAKRAKTAKSIQAEFRIALTGTPVENNLLELWSLFDFLNRGMLGTEDTFRLRYVDSDSMSVTPALKRAVTPLILRRRKEAVLEELPSKTEIAMDIELSKAERVMYESLRQKALKELQSADNAQVRFKVLAHLMTLREFCCHPSLANCQFKNNSAKMGALLELAQTLKDAGHRTLVFSQFVGFLSLIKTMFDQQGFSYSYLDGSTPAKERQKLVDEFNQGTNDFFLISLRAGGLGLNLTSADFVIILDPWWNPAVENQAADRVHRIGQTKPVTIYRLVCKDTVEERVQELQAKKSDLVREIFEDQSAPALKLDELMNLLR